MFKKRQVKILKLNTKVIFVLPIIVAALILIFGMILGVMDSFTEYSTKETIVNGKSYLISIYSVFGVRYQVVAMLIWLLIVLPCALIAGAITGVICNAYLLHIYYLASINKQLLNGEKVSAVKPHKQEVKAPIVEPKVEQKIVAPVIIEDNIEDEKAPVEIPAKNIPTEEITPVEIPTEDAVEDDEFLAALDSIPETKTYYTEQTIEEYVYDNSENIEEAQPIEEEIVEDSLYEVDPEEEIIEEVIYVDEDGNEIDPAELEVVEEEIIEEDIIEEASEEVPAEEETEEVTVEEETEEEPVEKAPAPRRGRPRKNTTQA